MESAGSPGGTQRRVPGCTAIPEPPDLPAAAYNAAFARNVPPKQKAAPEDGLLDSSQHMTTTWAYLFTAASTDGASHKPPMVEVLGHYSNHARAANAVIELLDQATQGRIRQPRLQTPAVKKTLERSGRLSKARIDELVERHQAGESARALAVEFGVHRETIRTLLKRRGLASRPPQLKVLEVDQGDPVRRCFELHGSVRATARTLGLSERVVARTLDEAGIARPRSASSRSGR